MLILYSGHAFHVAGAVHAAGVLVEHENHRTGDRKHRENPAGPHRFQSSASAKKFNYSQAKQDNRKGFVLAHFSMVDRPKSPGLRAEGPEFRIAEN